MFPPIVELDSEILMLSGFILGKGGTVARLPLKGSEHPSDDALPGMSVVPFLEKVK